jgi:glutamate 5-kinase
VPVINENDSVATHEIRFGDNDRLAARVAQAARASAVLLLSDVDGLYDRNPEATRRPAAARSPRRDGRNPRHGDGRFGSGMGSGGMTSKLQAAEIAELAGIALAIANGTCTTRRSRVRDLDGAPAGIGTLFLPRAKAGPQGRRAQGVAGRAVAAERRAAVDAGAAAALARGGSLLAKGVTGVEGSFQRGDAIAIRDAAGRVLAHGLSEYDAGECGA